jgi:hypothetical protein
MKKRTLRRSGLEVSSIGYGAMGLSHGYGRAIASSSRSQSGTLGLRTAIKSRNIRVIVSYEPGGDFLFPEGEAPAVPFGGTMSRDQELEVIRSGGIHYKHAEIFETSVRFIGTTAIVLNRIRLDAVVRGNEVTNPFTVTEVYVQQNGTWKLGALSFTRLLTQ